MTLAAVCKCSADLLHGIACAICVHVCRYDIALLSEIVQLCAKEESSQDLHGVMISCGHETCAFLLSSFTIHVRYIKHVHTVGCKSFGRNIRLGFKQQQQDLIYNHLCLRK